MIEKAHGTLEFQLLEVDKDMAEEVVPVDEAVVIVLNALEVRNKILDLLVMIANNCLMWVTILYNSQKEKFMDCLQRDCRLK